MKVQIELPDSAETTALTAAAEANNTTVKAVLEALVLPRLKHLPRHVKMEVERQTRKAEHEARRTAMLAEREARKAAQPAKPQPGKPNA